MHIILTCLCSVAIVQARTTNSLHDYQKNRTYLLNQEEALTLGGNLKLTNEETKVNEILNLLKTKELNESFLNPDQFNYSKHYFEYKSYFEESPVYKIIKKMPKGAALHVHSTFVVDSDYLLTLTYEDHLYACYTDDLKLLFSLDVPDWPCDGEWKLLSHLREAASSVKEFDQGLRKYLTMAPRKGHRMEADEDTSSGWRRFLFAHYATRSLLLYRPVREKIIRETLRKFYEDNVMYVELRSGLHQLYELNGTKYDPLYMINLHQRVVKEFKEEHPDFIGVKFIMSKSRAASMEEIREAIKVTIAAQKESPEAVAGFDIVGQEDTGHPLSFYLPVLLEAKGKIDFFFHAGETNWYGMPTDENLYDAILLGTKRIGHAYSLVKHPVLLSQVFSKNIAIEVNVISNSVLGLIKDVRNHPLATLFSLGAPVVLSSDDPGMWDAEPLSHDFHVAFMAVASRRADLRLLKQLALNSIQYSALESHRKSIFYRVFHKRWHMFLNDVIENYGHLLK